MSRILDINNNLIDAAKAEKIILKAKIAELDEENKLPTFNCHTHIFNFDHVHDKFIKGMVSIRFLFLACALILAALVLLLLLIHLLLGVWPLQVLQIIPVVYYGLLVTIVFLIVLYLLIRRIYITIRISWLKNHHLFRSITKRLSNLLPGRYDILDRMANFIKHSYDTKSNTERK